MIMPAENNTVADAPAGARPGYGRPPMTRGAGAVFRGKPTVHGIVVRNYAHRPRNNTVAWRFRPRPSPIVMPAHAGIQSGPAILGIPACAGMTAEGAANGRFYGTWHCFSNLGVLPVPAGTLD